ncbi:hypothetical protein SCAR479_11696 [Seiridium cardinale]|uniref:Uncharacterized protein n=1 Tax=Seiridium cardinale TaxID=138064 RepID=A0ABR2XD52_9PEZI
MLGYNGGFNGDSSFKKPNDRPSPPPIMLICYELDAEALWCSVFAERGQGSDVTSAKAVLYNVIFKLNFFGGRTSGHQEATIRQRATVLVFRFAQFAAFYRKHREPWWGFSDAALVHG